MITTIEQFKKIHESLFSAQGALNPEKKTIFTKTKLGPSFEVMLYAELKKILPHGYTFDMRMWGARHFLVITDISNKEHKFSLGENTTIYKVKNMVKKKFGIDETSQYRYEGDMHLYDIINTFPYIKLGAICNLDSTTDSDGTSLMLNIPANGMTFDITDNNAPEWDILRKKFKTFCDENALFDSDITISDDNEKIVFLARIITPDVNPSGAQYDYDEYE